MMKVGVNNSMKMIGYYHVYMTKNESTWLSIVMEQYKVMEDSGLFKQLDEFNIVCVGHSTEQFDKLMLLTSLYHNNVKQYRVKDPLSSDEELVTAIVTESTNVASENVTLKLIHDRAVNSSEEEFILYFHVKGISAEIRHFKNDLNQISQYRTYQSWRQYLNYGVLERWKDNIDALKSGYDVSGINYQTEPHKHYSGNFWWSTNSFLKTLPDPITYEWWYTIKQNSNDWWLKNASNRYADEHWVTSDIDSKSYNICDYSPNPAYSYVKREDYV